jgi:hypothetical protein
MVKNFLQYVILIAALCFSSGATAEWLIAYTYSKIEGKDVPLIGWNKSNEDPKIYLELRLNAKNQIGLWIRGFTGKENLGYVFPPVETFYVPMRVRIGKQIHTIKSFGMVFLENEWTVSIAIERGDNYEVMTSILNTLESNAEIALEFSNAGLVYSFTGGLKKLQRKN